MLSLATARATAASHLTTALSSIHTRPFFGRHTLAEAGTSHRAPARLLLLFRLVCLLSLGGLPLLARPADAHLVLSGDWRVTSAAAPCVLASGLALLCICSALSRRASAQADADSLLASVAVPVYFTGCLVGFRGAGMLVFLVDTLALGARVRLRLVYLSIPVALLAVDEAVLLLYTVMVMDEPGALAGAVAKATSSIAAHVVVGGSMVVLTHVVAGNAEGKWHRRGTMNDGREKLAMPV